jgi:serine protease Do
VVYFQGPNIGEIAMLERNEKQASNRTNRFAPAKQTRAMLFMGAICCLCIGIAIGSLLRGHIGVATATPIDNRLTISTTPTTPDSLSLTFARVAAQVEPCVVNIKVADNEVPSYAREGTGSGVIVNPQGFILTNQHVVQNAVKIKVKLFDNSEYTARIIGQDAETDLAVIKIDVMTSLPTAKIGDSDKLSVGEWVLAIGSPLGLEQTVTAGIISAKDRVAGKDQSAFQQFIQTDAAINPGNSGGPLINLSGEVVGINSAIFSKTPLFSGIGLAMPSSTAVDVYNQLVTNGRVRRAFLGIKPSDITPQIARLNKLPDYQGVLVERTTDEQSPAARAGLTSGDVIISVNNQKVRNFRELIRVIAALPIGNQANIAYVRGGKPMTASVKLEERQNINDANTIQEPKLFDPRNPKGLPEERPVDKQKFKPSLGLTVKFLSEDLARLRGFEGTRGVSVNNVEPHSIAGINGIRNDDIIVEINYNLLFALEDYQRLINRFKSGDDVVMKILRKDSTGNHISLVVSFTMP